MLYFIRWNCMEVFFMKTNCPHCGQHFEVEEELAGRSVECSSCGKPFTISAPEPTKRCPMCGEEILAVAKKCKHCGEYLDASAPEPTRIKTVIVPEKTNGGRLGNFRISNIVVALLIIAAIISAHTGIVDFDNPLAKSAIHQIYFAMRTVAFLSGSIILLLLAALFKMK